jgi:hypothetical protein
LALSKYDSTIEELRRASRLPYSRFPVNTDTDNPLRDLRIPYLQSLGSCSVVLVLRSVAELENNQSEKALADVKLILYLSDSIKGVPFLVISDDRSYVLDLAAQAIWEGLIENKWSADELVSIQQELSKADLSTNYETNLRAELAMDLSFIEFERQTHDADHDNDHTPTDEVDFQERMTRLYHRLFPQGWHYQNEAILADTFQQIFQVEAQAKQTILSPEVARQNDAASEFFEMRSDLPYYYYAEKFCPALGFYSPRLAFQQTSVNFAYTACALERYRLKHGE